MADDTRTATKAKVKLDTESILYAFDFTPLMESTESMSSVSSVTAVKAIVSSTGVETVVTALTIGSGAVNAATVTGDDGRTVAIGKAIQARISAGTAGVDYHVDAIGVTDAGNTRTLACVLRVRE